MLHTAFTEDSYGAGLPDDFGFTATAMEAEEQWSAYECGPNCTGGCFGPPFASR